MYMIAIVLDDGFGEQLVELTKNAYVWIIESEINRPWIERAWAAPVVDDDPLLTGVTSFARYEHEDTAAELMRIVAMVEEHHGEYAHTPAWDVLDVYGAPLMSVIKEELYAYGIERFVEHDRGFTAFRAGAGVPG